MSGAVLHVNSQMTSHRISLNNILVSHLAIMCVVCDMNVLLICILIPAVAGRKINENI